MHTWGRSPGFEISPLGERSQESARGHDRTDQDLDLALPTEGEALRELLNFPLQSSSALEAWVCPHGATPSTDTIVCMKHVASGWHADEFSISARSQVCARMNTCMCVFPAGP